MKNAFIDAVKNRIENPDAREAIAKELSAHIMDSFEYYIDLGYDEETALQRATEDMGNPDDTALPLNRLHPRYRKTLFLVLSLLFEAVFLLVAILRPNVFCYGSEHLLAIFHSIGIDFLSFGFITGFAVILVLSQKRKNKSVALSVTATFLIYLILSLINRETQGLCALFQPAAYATFTVATKGFFGYTDRIFAYMLTVESDKPIFVFCAVMIFTILLLWSLYQSVIILLQERMRKTAVHWGCMRTIKTVICVILSADLLLMTAGTSFAAMNFPNQKASAKVQREQMIDTVTLGNYQEFLRQLEENNFTPYYTFGENGFRQQQFFSEENTNNNTYILNTYSDSDIYYGFTTTNFASDLPLLSEDITIDDHTIENFKTTARDSNKTLNVFLQEDWYHKAISIGWYIRQYETDNGEKKYCYDSIEFLFLTKSGKAESITFQTDFSPSSNYFDNDSIGNSDTNPSEFPSTNEFIFITDDTIEAGGNIYESQYQ